MSARYRRHPGAAERRVGDALFLAQRDRGSLYRLNPTVAALWNLLATPVTLQEAVEVFVQAVPSERRARLAHDVEMMLDDLVEEDLVERFEG